MEVCWKAKKNWQDKLKNDNLIECIIEYWGLRLNIANNAGIMIECCYNAAIAIEYS